MPFIPHTNNDVQEMLSAIGVSAINDLFDEIPAKIAHANIDAMEDGMSESTIVRLSADRAPQLKTGACFIGAGAYEHYVPAAVWDIVTRGEFYTAYTPYQPEASQGTLEVIYEYQTLMTELMAMEVSNASLYDGASALAEAVLMAMRINDGARVLVPANLHPHYMAVLKSIIKNNVEFIEWHFDARTGLNDLAQLKKTDVDIVIIAQPNFFGGVEDIDAITNLVHEKNALVVGVVNPMAMAMLKPPGKWGDTGADIVCGEGQPLGVPLMGGGPYFGFLCCRKKDIRQLPGRIVGKTVDANGKQGFVLTLQAREQHIRRAKATSNICTNQGLLMTAATIYMRMLGGKGLQAVAQKSHENSEKLKKMLVAHGAKITFDAPTFHEFVVQFEKPIDEVIAAFEKEHIQAGFVFRDYFSEGASDHADLFKNCLLVCVTETKTERDLQKFVDVLGSAASHSDILPRDIASSARRGDLNIPHTAELDVVRHFTRLSQKNFSIETNFYPLGSCTMKYNPRAAKAIAMMPGYLYLHPLTAEKNMQGYLENLYELQNDIATLTGFEAVSLTPMAGAQGEFAGVAMIAAYHRDRGDTARTEMLIPDAAHGTNPASARMCGFTVKEIPTCTKTGDIDLEALKNAVSEKTAGIMLTNPSTFGVFERKITDIAEIVHKAGGLLYYDGANLNAILGYARPGDMGFDVMHLNCHKTFATPHGGGGPGAGPVAANARLKDYLPTPMVGREARAPATAKAGQITSGESSTAHLSPYYYWMTQAERPKSIGRLSCFMGNAGVLMRSHTYLKLLGKNGAKRVSQFATLNAHYLMKQLEKIGYTLAFPERRASHEFIVTVKPLTQKTGVTALDVAKRLLDFGIYAPTIYFPLLISECLLIEPTETECKATLDRFIEVMKIIYDEAHSDAAKLKAAPHTTVVGRLDEVKAAKELIIRG